MNGKMMSREEFENCKVSWISCEKKLPFAEYGASETVYCRCINDKIYFEEYRIFGRALYFNGENWCYPIGETFAEGRVTHWHRVANIFDIYE